MTAHSHKVGFTQEAALIPPRLPELAESNSGDAVCAHPLAEGHGRLERPMTAVSVPVAMRKVEENWAQETTLSSAVLRRTVRARRGKTIEPCETRRPRMSYFKILATEMSHLHAGGVLIEQEQQRWPLADSPAAIYLPEEHRERSARTEFKGK